jgi:hypothetical protein
MTTIFEKDFITPRELAEANASLGLTTQWAKRKNGELQYLRIGSRIIYSREHLKQFFASCEKRAEEKAEA